MRPQLTIAIPTYNRGNKLKLALENLLQCTKGKNVEILVSDNASTDNSEEVVRQVQRSHHEVQYFRNNSNLGFDGNFLNCFCRATGEYVWPILANSKRRYSYISVDVPTVERGLRLFTFCSMAIAGGMPFMKSHSGLFILPKNCLAYDDRLSI